MTSGVKPINYPPRIVQHTVCDFFPVSRLNEQWASDPALLKRFKQFLCEIDLSLRTGAFDVDFQNRAIRPMRRLVILVSPTIIRRCELVSVADWTVHSRLIAQYGACGLGYIVALPE